MHKVFLNSLPKAGTNLVAKALDLLGYHQAGTLDASFLDRYWTNAFRRLLYRPMGRGYLVGIDSVVEIRRAVVVRKLRRVGPDRYIIAHVGYTDDVRHLVEEMDFRAIQVIRDPRAVLASMVAYFLRYESHRFHDVFKAMAPDKRFEVALRGYRDRKLSLQPMVVRCLAVEPWMRAEGTLVIKFEDFVGPVGGGSAERQAETMDRLCQHLGLPRERGDAVAGELFGPGRDTFRKGQVDGWREEIPASVQEEAEKTLRPVLETWGYA